MNELKCGEFENPEVRNLGKRGMRWPMSQNEERGKNQRKTYENEYKENLDIEKEEFEVKGGECQIEIDFPIEIDESVKKRPITDCAESDLDSARSFVLKRCN